MASDLPKGKYVQPGTLRDDPLTPAPPAEPSDEALIEALTQAAANYVACTIEENEIDMDRADAALRARLASKDEALAEKHRLLLEMERQSHENFLRAEAAEGRIADLEALIAGSKKVTAGVFNVAVNAEAALAECRAKVIEECARVSDCYIVDGIETVNSVKREIASAIRALAKEAPRHE